MITTKDIERAKTGSTRHQDRLYTYLEEYLLRNNRYSLPMFKIEELVADTISYVFRYLSGLEPDLPRLRGYVSKAYRHQYIAYQRAKKAELVGLDYVREVEIEVASELDQEVKEALFYLMDQALSGKEHTVAYLFYFEGLTYNQIADSMGVNFNCIKTIICRAKRHLKQYTRDHPMLTELLLN